MKTYGGTQVLVLIALGLGVVGCGGGSSGGGAGAVVPGGDGAGSPGVGDTTPTPPDGGGDTTPTPPDGGGDTTPTPPDGGGDTTPPPTGGGGDTTPPPTGGGGGPLPGDGGEDPPEDPPEFDVSAASLGTNLVAVSYYTPQWPFVDAMKTSRLNSSGFPWDLVTGGQSTPKLDAQGYPIGLGSAQSVSALTLRGVGKHFPAGEYVVLFEGQGEVQVSFDGGRATHAHDGAGTARFTVNVVPSGNGVTVRISKSSATNHVRNVRLIMPGFEATYATQPFHPLFLERLEPFEVLRFMDWGATNRSPITSWSQRKLPDYRTQHGSNGVAYEVMADLCNRTRKHMWVCVPHKANDDYVRNLAALLRDEVDPGLKVFVEYSNEVWNGGFSQYNDVASVARSKGLEWYQWYTQRSVQLFKLFEQAFGGTERLVRVLGSQAGNPWIGKQIVAALPGPGAADALAIAPYFGSKLGNGSNWKTTRGWSVSQVLDACDADISTQRGFIRTYKGYTDGAGLDLIAYEGGQHLAGVGDAVNDSTLVSLLIQANRNARMRQLYVDYLAMWKAEGGGAFVHFNDVYVPQKWGSWGSLEYQDSDPVASPKFSALVEVAKQWAGSAAGATR